MRTAIGAFLLSLFGFASTFGQNVEAATEVRASHSETLVELSASGEIVNRGDRMHVGLTTNENAYVSVIRVDTEGRVRMLFPERPWHNNYVQAGRQFEIENPACRDESCAFVVDDYPGQGYIFAIASLAPLDFETYSNGDYWDYSEIARRGRVTGDPFVAFSEILSRVLVENAPEASSYDVFTYNVGGLFDFPRFLCYECHRYVRFHAWDPYQTDCSRIKVVRYDSPAYHPASTYESTRAVLTRTTPIEPRYLFEDRDPAEPFQVNAYTRPESESEQSERSTSTTATDVGGVGSIPAPLGRRGSAVDSLLRRLNPQDSVTSQSLPRLRLQPLLKRRKPKIPDSSVVIRPQVGN